MSKMMFLDELEGLSFAQKIDHYAKIYEAETGHKAHTVLVNIHQTNIEPVPGMNIRTASGINGNVFCLVGD